jgi:hypothetical protein
LFDKDTSNLLVLGDLAISEENISRLEISPAKAQALTSNNDARKAKANGAPPFPLALALAQAALDHRTKLVLQSNTEKNQDAKKRVQELVEVLCPSTSLGCFEDTSWQSLVAETERKAYEGWIGNSAAAGACWEDIMREVSSGATGSQPEK